MPEDSKKRDCVQQADGKGGNSRRPRKPRGQNKPEEKIDWSKWWPFDRATGVALEQLNRRVPKPVEQYDDAPY